MAAGAGCVLHMVAAAAALHDAARTRTAHLKGGFVWQNITKLRLFYQFVSHRVRVSKKNDMCIEKA